VTDDEAGVSRWILALQALGGWLAALFLLGFVGLGATAFVRGGGGWLALGLVTTAAAGALAQKAESTFLRQFLLPFLLAGQGAVMLGAVDLFHKGGWWLVAGFELAVGALIAWPLARFLAALAALFAMQAGVADLFHLGEKTFWSGSWLTIVYWMATCALLADEVRWRATPRALLLAAIAAALAVHSLLSVTLPLAIEFGGADWVSERLAPGVVQAALVAVAFGSLAWLGRDFWRAPRGWLPLAALAGALVATWQSPGISVGVTVLALGYANGRRWLVWLGGIVALAAIGRFYYFLPVGLLVKSGYLALGGLLLLATRQLLAAPGASVKEDGDGR